MAAWFAGFSLLRTLATADFEVESAHQFADLPRGGLMKRFAVLALSLALCCVCARAGDPPVTYVRAGKLLDVRSGKMLTDQVIVIRGEKIERVAAAAQVQIPSGANVVDLTRATVLPGLIDAHTHIFLSGEDNGRYDEQLLKESWPAPASGDARDFHHGRISARRVFAGSSRAVRRANRG